MMKEDKQLDELFRSSLDSFEMKPPAYVWDGIVEKQAAANRKKRMLWIRVGAVAAALLLAFVTGVLVTQEGSEDLRLTTPLAEVPSSVETTEINNRSDEIAQNESPESEAEPVESNAGRSEIILAEAKQESDVQLSSEEELVSFEQEFVQQESAPVETTDESVPGSSSALLAALKSALGNEAPDAELETSKIEASQNDELTANDRQIIEKNLLAMSTDKKSASKNGDRAWSVGANFAPGMSNSNTQYSSSYRSSMNQASTKGSLQLGGGLSASVRGKGRWSFQAGVGYSRMSQETANSPSGRHADAMLDLPSTGAGNGSGNSFDSFSQIGTAEGNTAVVNGPAGRIVMSEVPANTVVADFDAVGSSESRTLMMSGTEFEQVFGFIEIPLMARYDLLKLDQSFSMQLMGGITPRILVGNSAYMDNGSGRTSIGETEDLRTVNYSTSLGLGLGYQIAPNLQLRMEPQFNYYLVSFSTNSDISYKPYSFGLNTGISITF